MRGFTITGTVFGKLQTIDKDGKDVHNVEVREEPFNDPPSVTLITMPKAYWDDFNHRDRVDIRISFHEEADWTVDLPSVEMEFPADKKAFSEEETAAGGD